jgi:hypothetical protein
MLAPVRQTSARMRAGTAVTPLVSPINVRFSGHGELLLSGYTPGMRPRSSLLKADRMTTAKRSVPGKKERQVVVGRLTSDRMSKGLPKPLASLSVASLGLRKSGLPALAICPNVCRSWPETNSPGADQAHSQSISVSSEPSGFLARTVIQVKASCSCPFHSSPPSTSDANSNLTTTS